MQPYISILKTDHSTEYFNHTLNSELYRILRLKQTEDNNQKILKVLKNILPLPADVEMSTPTNLSLPSHHLMGKKFTDTRTQEEYTVTKVCMQFYGGWHYCVLLVDQNRSSTFLMFENNSCINEEIINNIKEFNEFFKLHE